MYETVGSVELALTPAGGRIGAVRQLLGAPILDHDPDTDPGLAWQSNIGQIIFLQTLQDEQS